MRKQAITLETIVHTLQQMQSSMNQRFSSIDEKFSSVDGRFDSMQKNINDIQSNVEFLVKYAAMKDDVRQIVQEEMKPIIAPLYATIDRVLNKHQTFEGEELAQTYRIDRLEQFVGLPKTA